ncbi:MAG: Ig-like domain-containing protein [Chitinophagales bacterium]|nr:Ig-like domain-containing protein [Chitinophagales bacterium]
MLKKILSYSIIALLLQSCASQMAPTGGDKDITPPVPVRSNPDNLSIHFHAQKITITFNEFIQTGDFGSQVFFSPALKIKPQYRVHGKTLSITLNDTLKPQTTYTVNFGAAVKDITEGNIMVNYQYVFSTGDYIDSLNIQGIVRGAEDGLPKENVLAMLYSDQTDSVVAKERPSYYAHSAKDGHFEISHIKEGSYKLIGLRDQNADLQYSPGEDIAFSDSAIEIKDSTGFYALLLFKPAAEQQKLLGAHASQPGRISIAFAKPINQLQVTPLTVRKADSVIQYNAARDTAVFFLNDITSDSITLQLKDGDFTDTIAVRMKPVNEKDKVLLPKFTITSALKGGRSSQQQAPDKPMLLQFSTPVTMLMPGKVLLLTNDTTKVSTPAAANLVADTLTLRKRGEVYFPFSEKTSYTLMIPDSAFRDVYGRFNDSVSITFVTFEKSATGNLLLKVTTDSLHTYFYELSNSSREVVARGKLKHGLTELQFNAMRPGDYSLKVIEDMNGNNRWDTGSYWKHLQPEKIYNYTDDITLRANWDLEVEMTVGSMQHLKSNR